VAWLKINQSYSRLLTGQEKFELPSFDCKSSFIHIFVLSSFNTTAMASRRLALNLAQGLRNRAALGAAPLKRGFATPVANSHGVKTESTTLSNGLTVCTIAVVLGQLTKRYLIDRNRAFSVGSDVDCRCLDRRRESGGNGQNQWYRTLLGASCFQGIQIHEAYWRSSGY
jgi:hypothetical protein